MGRFYDGFTGRVRFFNTRGGAGTQAKELRAAFKGTKFRVEKIGAHFAIRVIGAREKMKRAMTRER